MKKIYKKYETTKILLDVSRTLSSSLDMDKVSDLILKESMNALGADHASLFLMDELSGHLILSRARGFSNIQVDNIKLLGSWEVINDQLTKKKKSFIVNDVHKDLVFRDRSLPFTNEKMPIQSFLAVPLRKEREIVGALIVSNRKRPGHLFTKEDEELLVGLSHHVSIALLNAKLYQDLKDLFISTTRALVRAIEAKDPYTSGHSERVMKYSVAIGEAMKLEEDELEKLRLSSLLHDVGKIGIKEKILFKPGKLTDTQRKAIQEHPGIGERIVGMIVNSDKIIKGISEHHERFDGSGYPLGLKGNRISLQGRIVSVADTFDALTTNRPYQKKYTGKEALFVIVEASGKDFDPRIVKAFMKSFSRHQEKWQV